MSSSDLQPDNARTEELVAYLDGELPDAAARRVEHLLASDDEYRRQLGELDQAWSALDSLPTPTVDDKFARTTIEMVALAAKKDLTHRAASETAAARRRMLKFAACGLALVVASYVAARTLLPSQNRALLADLPVVARIDELTQIGDIDFLRGLTQLDIQQFNGDDDTRTRSAELEIPAGGWDNPDSRRSWVEHLSPDQRAELAGRLQRFQSLPGGPNEQRRVRQLETEIVDASDSALLQRTMIAYGQWLSGRSQGEQVSLREGSTSDRLKQVADLTRKANRDSGHKLSTDEEQGLREAINKFAEQHRSEMLEEFRRDNPDAARRAESEPKRTNMVVVMLAMKDEKLRDELHSQITAALSESNRQYLERLSQFDQGWQIRGWMRAAMNPKFGPQELERFFSEKLTNDQREKLLNLPQAKMETQLEQWYTASQLGIPERDWVESDNAGRFGRGGPGQGPGGGRPQRDRDDRPRGRGEGPPFGPRGFGRPDGPPGGPPPRDGRDRPGPPPDDRGPSDDHGPPPSDLPPRNG